MDTQVTNGGVPPADAEAAKYAALAKELGLDEPAGGGEQEPQQTKQEPSQGNQQQDGGEPAGPPRPSYEELAEHSRKTAGALKEEREARRAAEAREQAILKLIQETRAQRQQPAEPKKDDEPQIPDVNADPIAHFTARAERAEKLLEQALKGSQATDGQLRAWQESQAIGNAVIQSEEQIRNPQFQGHRADYDDAINYLKATRAAELDLMFPDASPQAQQMAQQHGYRSVGDMKYDFFVRDVQQVSRQALELGYAPAQYFYHLALSRGYQAKANSKAPEPPEPKGKQQLEATKRGRAASVSISGGGGGKGADNMSIAELTAMFDEDPDAAMAIFRKMGERGLL